MNFININFYYMIKPFFTTECSSMVREIDFNFHEKRKINYTLQINYISKK